MDMEEMTTKLRRGEPLYGKSEMDLYHQQVSASQSRYAQLKFRILPFETSPLRRGIDNVDIFPFFNFANHNQHGINIEKYIRALPQEEQEKYQNAKEHKMQEFAAYMKLSAESQREDSGEEGGNTE